MKKMVTAKGALLLLAALFSFVAPGSSHGDYNGNYHYSDYDYGEYNIVAGTGCMGFVTTNFPFLHNAYRHSTNALEDGRLECNEEISAAAQKLTDMMCSMQDVFMPDVTQIEEDLDLVRGAVNVASNTELKDLPQVVFDEWTSSPISEAKILDTFEELGCAITECPSNNVDYYACIYGNSRLCECSSLPSRLERQTRRESSEDPYGDYYAEDLAHDYSYDYIDGCTEVNTAFMVTLHNDFRSNGDLECSEFASTIARNLTGMMCSEGSIDIPEVSQVVADAGFTDGRVNVGVDNDSISDFNSITFAADTFELWTSSPDTEAIIASDFDQIGCAWTNCPTNNETYWACIYGNPELCECNARSTKQASSSLFPLEAPPATRARRPRTPRAAPPPREPLDPRVPCSNDSLASTPVMPATDPVPEAVTEPDAIAPIPVAATVDLAPLVSPPTTPNSQDPGNGGELMIEEKDDGVKEAR